MTTDPMAPEVYDCTCDATKPEHVHADTCNAWQDCPDCDGSGEIADYWNGYVGAWETKRCPSCNGNCWMLARDVADLRASRCEHLVPHTYEYGCADCLADRMPALLPANADTIPQPW